MGPDAIFAEPRLARICDDIEGERSDLDAYLAVAIELGTRSVLDVGRGTGTLACLLVARGFEVVGVDPAAASLEVARPSPERNACAGSRAMPRDCRRSPWTWRWTANVAQVFLTDEAWSATLRGIVGALRSDGHLVFEVRDPAARGWEAWTRERTRRTV